MNERIKQKQKQGYPRLMFGREKIDFIICSFIGIECLPFVLLSDNMIVRFTHRFDHHIEIYKVFFFQITILCVSLGVRVCVCVCVCFFCVCCVLYVFAKKKEK